MACEAPFKLSQTEVPKRILICNKITNRVFLSLNATLPILYGVGFIGELKADQKIAHDKFLKMGNFSYDITLFTPILSGAFLFTALYLIKKSVGNNSQVNIKAMTLHATSFGLYMASVLLWICIYSMYTNGKFT